MHACCIILATYVRATVCKALRSYMHATLVIIKQGLECMQEEVLSLHVSNVFCLILLYSDTFLMYVKYMLGL